MRKLLRILAIAYLVYLGIVLLVITPALYFLPPHFARDYLGRELQAKYILFNPFTLSLEARELALPDRDGSPFVSLDSASVNVSLASIWRPGIVFDRIAVQGLLVAIKQAADGSFNFADMLPGRPPGAARGARGHPGHHYRAAGFPGPAAEFQQRGPGEALQ